MGGWRWMSLDDVSEQEALYFVSLSLVYLDLVFSTHPDLKSLKSSKITNVLKLQ